MNYYQKKGISQSYLKRFINPNPRSLHRYKDTELYDEVEATHFSKGKLLDLLIEDIDYTQYFHIESELRVTPKVHSILKEFVDEGLGSVAKLIEIKNKQNYQARWTEEKNIEWANSDEIRNYITYLIESNGKTIITQQELEDTIVMSNSIMEGEYTSPIINDPNYTNHYQLEMYYEDLKGLADLVQIHKTLKLIRLIDFKSTSDYLEKFPFVIKKFKYDIQLSFYKYLLQKMYPTHKVECYIIAVCNKEIEYAEPFLLTDKILHEAEEQWEELLKRCRNYKGEMYNSGLIEKGYNEISEL